MSRVRGGVVAAVDALPLALLAVVLPVGVAVTAGWHTPWFVLPGIVAGAALVWWLAPRTAGDASCAVPALVALLGAAAWTVVHLRYTGEYVTVDRDPAVYTLTGIWLIDNPQVTVPMDGAAAAVGAVPPADGGNDLRTVGLGFGGTTDRLSPQFAHTLPGVLALGGWLGGTTGVLAASVPIAALALLALYGLTRRLLGPWWGLLPPAALGLAMPMVAFARIAYSEPLSMAVAFVGLTLLARALTEKDAPLRVLVLAGLALGSTGLVRVDGGLVVIGAIASVGVVALLSPAGDGLLRGAHLARLMAVAAPATALLALGMLDMARNSGTYLDQHAAQVVGVLGGVVAAWGGSALLVWFAPRWQPWVLARVGRLAAGVAAATAGVLVLLLSRRWWWEARWFEGAPGFVRDIERRQAEEGLALDGARSYDELTLDWVAWYHGWPVVLVGLVGLVGLAWVAVARRRSDWLVVLLGLGVPGLLYLVYPSITPDHVWAMRRLVPAAVPLLLIGATAVLVWLASRTSPRAGALLGVAGGLTLLAWPTLSRTSNSPPKPRVGQVDEAAAACAQVQDGRIVIANGVPGVDYLPTVRILCDAQVVAVRQTSASTLASLQEAWGGEPLRLLTYDVDGIPWTQEPGEPVTRVRLEMWQRSLIDAPSAPLVWQRTMWSGTVQPDGRVVPDQ